MILNRSWLFDIILRHRAVQAVIMEGFDFTFARFALLSGLSGLLDEAFFVFMLYRTCIEVQEVINQKFDI